MDPTWKKVVYVKKADLVADLEVSSDGQVRSIVSKRIFSIHVKDNQKYFERRSNRIPLRYAIVETFIGPLGEDEEVEFLDGNKMNCVISNLRIRPKARRGEDGTNAVIIPPRPPMALDDRLMRLEAKIIEQSCRISDLDDRAESMIRLLWYIIEKSGWPPLLRVAQSDSESDGTTTPPTETQDGGGEEGTGGTE